MLEPEPEVDADPPLPGSPLLPETPPPPSFFSIRSSTLTIWSSPSSSEPEPEPEPELEPESVSDSEPLSGAEFTGGEPLFSILPRRDPMAVMASATAPMPGAILLPPAPPDFFLDSLPAVSLPDGALPATRGTFGDALAASAGVGSAPSSMSVLMGFSALPASTWAFTLSPGSFAAPPAVLPFLHFFCSEGGSAQ